ncbi:MAG: dihydrofolate reductase [Rhodothermales bacterium]
MLEARKDSKGDASATKRPELVIIAALAESNRVIGKGLSLPWHIPEDLKRFKRLTRGHPLLMGRKTFESLIAQFGKPLPERRHLVLTHHPETVSHPTAECFQSLEEALAHVSTHEIVFVAGGATIYEQTIASVDRLELTLVEGKYEGDAFFPPWTHLVGPVYELVSQEKHDRFRYETYRRRRDLTFR